MKVAVQLLILLNILQNGLCQGIAPGTKDRSRGTFLGYFSTLQHQVSGAVWALDDERIHVEEFTYDGRGPDPFFWVGTEGDQPTPRGYIVPFPSNASAGGSEMVLPAFHGTNVLFRLPSNYKVGDLRWISVWCRRFTVNFGSLLVPQNLDLPKKRKLSEFSRLAHGVRSGNVTLLDAKTIYIPNLHYDGSAPDAFFWVGKGSVDRTGMKIPNEKKSYEVLGHYDGVDIELVLPDNLTVYDIEYLSIWCVTYRHDFGHVRIPSPSDLFLPPAMGQTQVKSFTEVQPGPKDQYNHGTDQVLETTTDATNESTEASSDTTTEFGGNNDVATEVADTTVESAATTQQDTETTTEMTTETNDPSTIMPDMTTLSLEEASNVTFSSAEYLATESPLSDGSDPGNELDALKDHFATKIDVNTFVVGTGIVYDFKNVSDDSFTSLMNFKKNYVNLDGTKYELYEFGGLPDANLKVDENTFTYKTDPQVSEMLNKAKGKGITEVIIRNSKKEYTFAVGNDHAIQHIIDSFNDGDGFDPNKLVRIDTKQHIGAHFESLPEETDDENDVEPEGKTDDDHHDHDHDDDKNEVRHHPKDIYIQKFDVNFTDIDNNSQLPRTSEIHTTRISAADSVRPIRFVSALLTVAGLTLIFVINC